MASLFLRHNSYLQAWLLARGLVLQKGGGVRSLPVVVLQEAKGFPPVQLPRVVEQLRQLLNVRHGARRWFGVC